MENTSHTPFYFAKKVGKGIAITIFIILAILLFGWVFMHLWNWLMPAIFGLTVITFKQAIGILIMSKILFGGFGNGSGKRKDHRWKSHMKHKWESMSPDERAAFKKKMESRWSMHTEQTNEDSDEDSIQA